MTFRILFLRFQNASDGQTKVKRFIKFFFGTHAEDLFLLKNLKDLLAAKDKNQLFLNFDRMFSVQSWEVYILYCEKHIQSDLTLRLR